MSIFNDPLQPKAFNLLNPTSEGTISSLLQQNPFDFFSQVDAIRKQNELDAIAQQQRRQAELAKQRRSPREGFINFLDLLSDTGLRLQGQDPETYKATQKELLLELEDKKRKRQKALEQKEQLGTVIGNLNIPKSQKDFILSLNQASQADVVSKLMFPVNPKETSAIQEYKFAQNQGYEGTFTDFKNLNKQVTNINLGPQGQDFGDPPKDTAWQRDKEGKVVMDERGIPIALPIQGTPTFAKQQKVLTQEKKSGEEVVVTGGVVLGNINQIKNAIENSTLPTTGLGGQILRNIGGTAALDINKLIDPIQASIGFDRLQRMREASPTGGALGQVSERELDLLMATLSSLDQAQSEEQFLQSLNKVETRYKNIIKKFNVYPEEAMLEVGYIPIDLGEDSKVIDGYKITPK